MKVHCNIGGIDVDLPDEAGVMSGTTIEPCKGCKFPDHVARLEELDADLRIAEGAGLYSATLVRKHHVSVYARERKDPEVQFCSCDCDVNYQRRR